MENTLESHKLVTICRHLNSKPYNAGIPRKILFVQTLLYLAPIVVLGLVWAILFVLGLKEIAYGIFLIIIIQVVKLLKASARLKKELKPYTIKNNFSYKDWLMVLDEQNPMHKKIHHQKIGFIKNLMDNQYLDVANTHHYDLYKGHNYPKKLKTL